jgi:hypothetical protein
LICDSSLKEAPQAVAKETRTIILALPEILQRRILEYWPTDLTTIEPPWRHELFARLPGELQDRD